MNSCERGSEFRVRGSELFFISGGIGDDEPGVVWAIAARELSEVASPSVGLNFSELSVLSSDDFTAHVVVRVDVDLRIFPDRGIFDGIAAPLSGARLV